MTAPALAPQAAQSYGYPQVTFGKREQQLLASVLNYVGANSVARTVAAAQYTTVGGSAAEAITITGVLSTDLAFVQVKNDGTNNVTLKQASCTANTLTLTFSADPGNDAVIYYSILRLNA